MKRQDTVFLLTLIDFLFQVIFFGLFVYAIYSVKQDPNYRRAIDSLREKFGISESSQIREIVEALPSSLKALEDVTKNGPSIQKELGRQGVSNIAELTDTLSRLAPVRDLAAGQAVVEKLGGKENAATLSQFVESAGGYKQAKEVLQKYVKEGVGKPHCDPISDSKGKIVGARPLATITGFDSKLVFQRETPQLSTVLDTLGLQYSQVETLTMEQFKMLFKSLPSKIPDCVHTVTFREATRLVDARDAVRPYFRLSIQKVSN